MSLDRALEQGVKMDYLQNQDPELWRAIEQEQVRQHEGLELIASENYTSPAVLQATGTVLTNKYAEGYPGRRYYGGCECVDVVEQLAIDRAKQLFGAEAANVQPHAGSQANMAVYFACLQPGDTVLAMNLAHGGHLTHGSPVNFSGKLYQIVPYGVDQQSECIDYDRLGSLAREHRPRMILAGHSAYPRRLDFELFAEIANEVDAVLVVDMAHFAGLVAGGVHPSPVPYADFVTSTAHKTLRGPRSGFVLCKQPWLKKLNSAVFPGMQGGPLMHVVAAKAVCFQEAAQPEFAEYAGRVVANAAALAEQLSSRGFRLSSGGTENHLILMDVTSHDGLSGKIAESALDQAAITVNKNMIPFDPRKPMDPSGIRIGTPAVTTRGMGTDEMKQIARWIEQVCRNPSDPTVIQRTRGEVVELCGQFPIPGVSLADAR